MMEKNQQRFEIEMYRIPVPESGKSGNFGMSIRIRNPVKSNRILPDLIRLKFVEFSVKK